jgi:hypothetical protein
VAALMRAVGARFEERQLCFNEQPHATGLEDPKVKATGRIHDDSFGQWRDLLSPRDARMIKRRTRKSWRQIDPAGDWL